jgi:hypothetical protein
LFFRQEKIVGGTLSAQEHSPNIWTRLEFINAKPIDLTLRSANEALQAWAQELSTESSEGQQSFLSLSPAIPHHFEHALQMLIENVLLQHPAPFLSLSKSWADYPSASRYNPNPLPLSSVIAATEFLRDKGWLLIHPGSKELGLRTRLEPTPAFKNALEQAGFFNLKIAAPPIGETILLRDKDKVLMDYAETLRTQSMRRHLHAVNSFLRSQVVMYSGRRLNTTLVRIFKENFMQGGRFYRAEHLALKSAERNQITLNGENVVEIDFACLHINMLYIRETGKPYEGDAYQSASSHSSNHSSASSTKIPRDVFKIILQIILNCETEFAANLAANEALRSRGFHISAETAIQTFLKKHQPIAKYFFSGIGLQLQYEDSVIAEKVLLKAVQAEIPVLPVHDSFLAPADQEIWLLEAMHQASYEVLGAALPVKIKRFSPASTTAA